jgi:hypothetical protein
MDTFVQHRDIRQAYIRMEFDCGSGYAYYANELRTEGAVWRALLQADESLRPEEVIRSLGSNIARNLRQYRTLRQAAELEHAVRMRALLEE